MNLYKLSLIIKHDIRQNIINKIVLEHEFKECFNDVLGKAISDVDLLDRLRFGEEDITDLKKKISSILYNTK